MIYNFHHFYYWMLGGLETGQAYRAKQFRELGLEAKFVFATTFPDRNIQHETSYLGFLDSEVIWMYGFFSDCKISPVTFTLEQLENTFEETNYSFSRDGNIVKYLFPDLNAYYIVYMTDKKSNFVHRVVMISNGCLIRKDYYTYCRYYSEYYIPMDGNAHLYLRRFYNENGSVAYEELTDVPFYKFPDRILYSREELLGYMMDKLNFSEDDVVLLDVEPGMIEKEAFIRNAAPAKIGLVMHANHFWNYYDEHILWYGIYEYAFAHFEKISFFITNTDAQSNLLREQFKKYLGVEPDIRTIPAAGLDKLKIPEKKRRKHALISAGRLEPEKQMDQAIKAVVAARKEVPDVSLDIYGDGSKRAGLEELIGMLGCGDYVHLCGFHKLDEKYQEYEAYLSSSNGETLGVSLMEALGSGLPIVSYDVPYGAQIFIDEGKNGYKVPGGNVDELAKGIIRLFTEADLEAFQKHSYKKAEAYLTEEVKKKWKNLLC